MTVLDDLGRLTTFNLIAYFQANRHAELDSASPNKKTKTDSQTDAESHAV